MNIARISHKFKQNLDSFLGNFSESLGAVRYKFVRQFCFGMLKSRSCRLSDIHRALGEKTSVKKGVERLSRNLGTPGLWEDLSKGVLNQAKWMVQKDDYLIVDISELVKKHGKRMENLCTVRDASEQRAPLKRGYWSLFVVATNIDKEKSCPLYHRIYSSEAPDFISENEEIKKALEMLDASLENKGIIVMDRGGDRRDLYKVLKDQNWKFIIRSLGTRTVIHKNKEIVLKDLVKKMSLGIQMQTKVITRYGEQVREVEVGWTKVKLPGFGNWSLRVVVVKKKGRKPMILLTNLGRGEGKNWVKKVVKGYWSRGRVEEEIRFVKQEYREEEVMVRRYEKIQAIAGLVLLASYFVQVHMGYVLKWEVLFVWLLKLSKRVGELKRFPAYALMDGITELLKRTDLSPPQPKTSIQLPMLPFS